MKTKRELGIDFLQNCDEQFEAPRGKPRGGFERQRINIFDPLAYPTASGGVALRYPFQCKTRWVPISEKNWGTATQQWSCAVSYAKSLMLILLFCLFSQTLLAQTTVVEEPILPSLSAPKTARIDHSVLTEVLKRYVNRYGLVEYSALKRDKDAVERLKRYTQDLLQIDGTKLEPLAEKMAYWLNLYNTLVLQKVLEHYPINTVTLIPRFFDEPRYQLQGFDTKLSLLDIEQKIFREQLPDPRLHLARVTGSLSGPSWLTEAYQSTTLEKKLEEVTLMFLTDTTKNFYDRQRNTFLASPVFLWFIDDFSRYAFSPLGFIQARLAINRGTKLQYSGYDWRLNDAKLR